jgi:hypothetical protein
MICSPARCRSGATSNSQTEQSGACTTSPSSSAPLPQAPPDPRAGYLSDVPARIARRAGPRAQMSVPALLTSTTLLKSRFLYGALTLPGTRARPQHLKAPVRRIRRRQSGYGSVSQFKLPCWFLLRPETPRAHVVLAAADLDLPVGSQTDNPQGVSTIDAARRAGQCGAGVAVAAGEHPRQRSATGAQVTHGLVWRTARTSRPFARLGGSPCLRPGDPAHTGLLSAADLPAAREERGGERCFEIGASGGLKKAPRNRIWLVAANRRQRGANSHAPLGQQARHR